ncbi:mannan endo-1,4-beta-mannosidase 4-like [Actinidia eriantha]|uniref:mannan endo-1,4-beta-mannosidase 4-like n=1 Tax=Actinidia eriantha TaxID=165200 RepID=UPI00258F8956|nr:mannan endo-1,4-beta-mannosidase 4-like [Actinidia eriantha]
MRVRVNLELMMRKRLFNNLIFLALLILSQQGQTHGGSFHAGLQGGQSQGFVKTSGTHFVMNGRRLYLNGFNAYWMMYMASDGGTKAKVTTTFQQVSKEGMNVARAWAFSDGGNDRPLQSSPGSYNEDVFKGLDFVISEARKYGVYLILSLVNNWEGYGGKKQYVQWARDQGQSLNSEDDFFSNPLVKGFFKNHIKAILTRVNSITRVAYKDDPTIFAWELMNEPRCQSDLSGKSMQDWITEMAGHVKSIDKNHLLEIGLEGFYGESLPEKKQFNPGGSQVGTDFISNNRIPGIDFATIHLYPDQWISGSNDQAQAAFVDSWIQAHIQDSGSLLGKPLLLAEFGKSSKSSEYSVGVRDTYFGNIYNAIYASAKSGGSCGGGIFWQLMASGMDGFRDGYEVVLDESPSTANVIAQQSRRLSALS